MHSIAVHSAVAALLCCTSLSAQAEDQPADALPLRNHNPILQIFGLPSFQTPEVSVEGAWDISFSYDIANDADDASRPNEELVIDGESQVLAISLRRRVSDKLELGLDVPFVSHSGGFLDGTIKDWHNLLGLSNSMRDGPNDQLQHYYELDGVALLDFSESTSGIGDVQISAAIPLQSVTIRAGAKLPTGDAEKLTGSGAADFSLGVYGARSTTIFDRELDISGFVGVLALGDGDVMSEFQRSAVPYGGLALRWHATEKFALSTQWYVQGSYFDIDIDEIGGSTIQLGVGVDYRLRKSFLRFAIVEDVAAGAAPDFALHLSLRSFGG